MNTTQIELSLLLMLMHSIAEISTEYAVFYRATSKRWNNWRFG